MSDLFGGNPRERGHDQQPSGDGAHEHEGATWHEEEGEAVRLVDEDGVEFEGEAVRYIDEDGVEREAVRYVDDDGVEHIDDTGEIAQVEPAGVVPVGAVSRARPRRRWVGLLVLLVCGILVGGAAFFGFDQVRQVVGGLTASDDYEGPGSGQVDVVIKEGDSGKAIGATLEKAGVVKSAGAFVDAVNAGSGASLQPGTYTLKKEMSAAGALALLQSPASKINIQVRVREGLWKSEVFEAISKETKFTTAQLEEAAKNPEVGLPAEAGGDIEGYLFPATYTFDPDVTPVGVLKAMVTKYNEEMTKAQVAPDQRRRVLILASLVQAEASKPDDFPKVARVIENRLVKQPKVPLGFDTTVNFAVKKRGFDLTKADLDVDSPYNTRKAAGLPPGPIDSPGAAAIEAAAHPAEGDWLYFVTTNPDTGETLFTSDYNEFLAGKATFNEWYKKQQNG